MLLHFFELGETFFYILIEFLLDLIGDGHQAGVDPVTNGVETLRGFLIQAVELGFQLRRGECERTGQFGAGLVVRRTVPGVRLSSVPRRRNEWPRSHRLGGQ